MPKKPATPRTPTLAEQIEAIGTLAPATPAEGPTDNLADIIDEPHDSSTGELPPTAPEPFEYNYRDEDVSGAAEDIDAGGFLSDRIAVDTVEMAAETLTGDLRDLVLDLIRHTPRTWREMTEAQQRDVAETVEAKMATAVRRACILLGAAGRRTIVAELEQYKQKGPAAVATLKLPATSENMLTLVGVCQRPTATVQILTVDATPFVGERAPAEIDADQPEIPLDGDDAPLFDQTPQGADAAADPVGEAALEPAQ